MKNANPELVLNDWETSLFRQLQAHQAGLFLQTTEETRVMMSIFRAAQQICIKGWGKRDITRWSIISTERTPLLKPREVERSGPEELFAVVRNFVDEKDDEGASVPGLLILCDMRVELEGNPATVRLLREAVMEISARGLRKTIIILGAPFTLPAEIRAEYPAIEFEIPSTAKIEKSFGFFVERMQKHKNYAKIKPSKEIIHGLARACTGLTEIEAHGMLALALARFEAIDDRGIKMAQKEKAKALLRGGSLEMREPRGGLEMVGGLDRLKAWVDKATPIVQDPKSAQSYGLRIPSGLLLVGIPGCGKSLLAESLGGHWGLPVLLFNVGAAFASHVGESEANIRQMQQTAEAMKPCIVMIDEIEKGLGGDGLDGGTSNRVKQSLLTWLQEKSDEIFVVATANDLRKLQSMPELIRAGRFDKQFFVDLPDAESRATIFKIHLTKSGHELPDDQLVQLAKATKAYSGAEIEVIVQEALRESFAMDPRPAHPPVEVLQRCIKTTKPLSETMKESIEVLRQWCKEGRAEAAGRTLEEDAREAVEATAVQAKAAAVALPDLLSDMAGDSE